MTSFDDAKAALRRDFVKYVKFSRHNTYFFKDVFGFYFVAGHTILQCGWKELGFEEALKLCVSR